MNSRCCATFKSGDRVKYIGRTHIPGDELEFGFFYGHTGTVQATGSGGDNSMVRVLWDAPMPEGAWWNEDSNWFESSLELAEFDVDAWRTDEESEWEDDGWGFTPSALSEAYGLVNGDRNADYGHPLDDFQRSADMWSNILGTEVTAEQVALCMIAVKVSRLSNDIEKRDSWVDIAGYVECWQRIQNRREGLE